MSFLQYGREGFYPCSLTSLNELINKLQTTVNCNLNLNEPFIAYEKNEVKVYGNFQKLLGIISNDYTLQNPTINTFNNIVDFHSLTVDEKVFDLIVSHTP